MPRRTTALVLCLVLLLAGCGDAGDAARGSSGGRTLTVFAAASLTESFTDLGRAFETAHPGTRVRFNFGGSSALAQQITQGAPADVFAAASPATMRVVTGAGAAAGRPRTFARNRLVIAVPKDNPGGVRTLRDLAGPGRKVVLCAEQVPCGAAARTIMDVAGPRIEPVSREQDVKAVLTKVRLGEADAGLVYRTDVKSAAAAVQGIDFAESAKAINDYPIAALSKAPNRSLADRFVATVLAEQGRTTLTRAGFQTP